MASSVASMNTLARVFGLMKISKGDQDGLRGQCGITTVQHLIDNRARLAISSRTSKTCRLLVAVIDYIAERRKKEPSPIDDSKVDKLFTSCKALGSSWEHFLALMIEKARNNIDSQERQSEHGKSRESNTKSGGPIPLGKQKKFKDGDVYWENLDAKKIHDSDSGSDDDDYNEEKERDPFGGDSLWRLEREKQEAVLKDNPTSIRIPMSLFTKLYDFQRDGIAWIAGLYHQDTGGILGDEMGMGKTLQALVFLFSLMCTGAIRNALIVCPKSTLETTWLKEAKKLVPYFKWKNEEPRLCLIGSSLSEYQRRQLLKVARSCSTKQPHLIVSSYPQIQKKGGFQPGNKGLNCFDYIVLDEGHRVKNTKSMARQNIHKISKHSKRLILTGTPFINCIREVHSLLSFATGGDEVIGKEKDFNAKFRRPIEAGKKLDASKYEKKKSDELIAKLQDLIRPYLLQRKKDDYLKNLLPKSYQFDVWTRLSPMQRKLYSNFVEVVQHQLTTGGTDKPNQLCVLPAIHRLREICNHPMLYKYKKSEDSQTDPLKEALKAHTAEVVISQSPKLGLLIDLLHEWRSKGFKALVFSESVKMLNIIEHVLFAVEGINTCRIDGSTSQKKRKDLVEDFNRIGSYYNVLLLSIQAGGEGLTLTGANKSVIYDPSWNQAKPDQAAARINRPGQTRETECIHLMTAGTVEEKMVGKQIYKGCMDRHILGATNQKSFYDKEELTKLFTLEPDGVCESLERFKQSEHGAWTTKCSTSKEHKAVVGISRRSKVYKDK